MFRLVLAGAVLDPGFRAKDDVQCVARANFWTLRSDCFSASTLHGSQSRAASDVHFCTLETPRSMTYASRSLDCAILVSDQRSCTIACFSSSLKSCLSHSGEWLHVFRVAAFAPSVFICPNHISLLCQTAVANSRALARCVRSLRHQHMLRVFRAVLPRTHAYVNACLSVLGEPTFAPACFGRFTRLALQRMRVAILHSLRN